MPQGLENLCPKIFVTVDESVTDAILSEAVQKAGALFSGKVVERIP
jgi:hypothetical protein